MAVLAHIGFVVVYALRVNLSVALVAMVNNTYANPDQGNDPECSTGNRTVEAYNGGIYNWDKNEQGFILSSFFYGYLFTQLPGGFLASKYGGKWVFGIGILCTSLLTLVTPLAAGWGFKYLIAVRILEGLGEGVTFPAVHAMMGVWAPAKDRTKMTLTAYSGMQTGTVIAMPLSGLLADSNILGGWPSIFYFFGASGIIWFVFWWALAFSTPDSHPRISVEEKLFIESSLQKSAGKKGSQRIPWLSIICSTRVWAITVAHFCNNWVWYMVLTGLPSYFKDVLDFNMKENGFVSAAPFLVAFFVTMFVGYFADIMRRKWISTTLTRKIMGFIGFLPSAGFLVLASYAGCDQITLSVVYMTLATGLLQFNQAAYTVNHIDIAPRYSGILMGISNSFGTVAGCITPTVTGIFTNKHATRHQYQKVFFIATGMCLVGGLFYALFASGEEQSWNNPDSENDDSSKALINPGSDADDPSLV